MLEKFHNVATVFCLYPVLDVINCVSVAIQAKSNDIGRVCDLIDELTDTLKVMQDDSTFSRQYKKAQVSCRFEDIEVEPTVRSQRRRPVLLDDAADTPGLQPNASAAESIDQSNSGTTWKSRFKEKMWLPFFDAALAAIASRFGDDAMAMGRAVASFTNFVFDMHLDTFRFFLDHFPMLSGDRDRIVVERLVWDSHMKNNFTVEEAAKISGNVTNIIQYVYSKNMHIDYPFFYKAMCVAGTIAFTSASCERSFSSLDFIKSALRTTMNDERLNDLMTSYCNRDVVVNIGEDELVREFAKVPR